jgi:long-subunit acyl-CoA synthetase (AMP-forming)
MIPLKPKPIKRNPCRCRDWQWSRRKDKIVGQKNEMFFPFGIEVCYTSGFLDNQASYDHSSNETCGKWRHKHRGEVIAKSDNIMVGYWGKPVETEEGLTKDGWYWTRDLAEIDENGYIYIVDIS